MPNILNLSIPDTEWKPLDGLDDPLSGLTGPTLVINGLSMHMEAWQVFEEAEGQVPADEWQEEYVDLHAAVHAEGSFSTVKIGDRNYIVVISPHCD
jgi:hypothetical protein